MGYWSFFENFIQIAVLLLAWAIVLLSFFIQFVDPAYPTPALTFLRSS